MSFCNIIYRIRAFTERKSSLPCFSDLLSWKYFLALIGVLRNFSTCKFQRSAYFRIVRMALSSFYFYHFFQLNFIFSFQKQLTLLLSLPFSVCVQARFQQKYGCTYIWKKSWSVVKFQPILVKIKWANI